MTPPSTTPEPVKYYTDPGVEVYKHSLNPDGTGRVTLNNYEHPGKRTDLNMSKPQMDVLLGYNQDPQAQQQFMLQRYKPTNLAQGLNNLASSAGTSFQDYASNGGLKRALLYGGLAALGGGAYGAFTGRGGLGRGLKYGGLAVGGLGLAALLYKLMSRTQHNVSPAYTSNALPYGKKVQANFFGSSFQDISSYVANDTELSFQEKADIMRALPNLTPGDKAQLSDMLLSVGGAGAGALIARFLGAKGLLGIGLGAILGGIAGWSFGGPRAPQLTAGGLISSNNFR